MNIISFTVGDWSNDGHNQSDTFQVETNVSMKEIENAYQEGVAILGYDLFDFCEEYEDNSISKEFADKLVEYKIAEDFDGYHPLEKEFDNDPDMQSPSLDPDQYLDIYLGMVKLGNPSIILNRVKGKDLINLGGYGLYH